MRPEPIVRWPTSELPICPSGRPTAPPDAASVAVRIPLPERVEDGRLGELDGVARAGRREPPPVEDDEDDRAQTASAAARQIASNDVDVERGAADERAVHVRQPEQDTRVLGLHRAAVEHGRVVQRLDERVGLLRDLRRRGLPGADRPHGLVGDDEPLVPGNDADLPARARPRSRRPRAPPRSPRRTR